MYVVAGATGRVGSATAKNLLEAGVDVRVLVRREADAEKWKAQGAEARVVTLDDQQGLTDALRGSSGFFVLLPFDLTVADIDSYADTLIASITGAVSASEVPQVVLLSSAGADLPEGTGPITGLYRLERALRATGATVTALRPGYFQEGKVSQLIGGGRESDEYPVYAASADRPLSMVASRDIGAVAAELLLSPPTISEAIDIIGPIYSERAVAETLGQALGKELRVVTIPEDEWSDFYAQAGLRPNVAEILADMHRAEEQGRLNPRGDRSIQVTTSMQATIDRMLGT